MTGPVVSRGIVYRCYDSIGFTPETCVEDGVITHTVLPEEISDWTLAEQIGLVWLAAAAELRAQQEADEFALATLP